MDYQNEPEKVLDNYDSMSTSQDYLSLSTLSPDKNHKYQACSSQCDMSEEDQMAGVISNVGNLILDKLPQITIEHMDSIQSAINGDIPMEDVNESMDSNDEAESDKAEAEW